MRVTLKIEREEDYERPTISNATNVMRNSFVSFAAHLRESGTTVYETGGGSTFILIYEDNSPKGLKKRLEEMGNK